MSRARNHIVVLDMTKLFTKEILLYSLFDIAFRSPVRLMLGVYIILLGIIWSLPMAILLWPLNVYTALIVFGPTFALANLMSKPIWGGKSFPSWLKAQLFFASNPKHYYDNIARKDIGNEFKIDNIYTVSRRDDYRKLLILSREEGKKLKKVKKVKKKPKNKLAENSSKLVEKSKKIKNNKSKQSILGKSKPKPKTKENKKTQPKAPKRVIKPNKKRGR